MHDIDLMDPYGAAVAETLARLQEECPWLFAEEADVPDADDLDAFTHEPAGYAAFHTAIHTAPHPAPLTPDDWRQIEEMAAQPLGRINLDAAAENRLTLRWAFLFAKLGYRVIAGNRDTKRPLSSRWPERASCDPAEVLRNFTEFLVVAKKTGKEITFTIDRPVNICIATGPGSAAEFVLDVDGAVGKASLAKLEQEHGRLPLTVQSISGSGKGAHYIFRMPEGMLPPGVVLHQNAGKLGWEGSALDTRVKGGQIVVAPSVHPSGGRYRWAPGRSPWQIAPAEAPRWLIELAIQASKKTKAEIAAATGAARPVDGMDAALAAALGAMGTKQPDGAPHGWRDLIPWLGYGDGTGNGCHDTINRIALSFFREFGHEADTTGLVADIRARLDVAMKDYPDKRVSYFDDAGAVPGRIENARDHAKTAGFPAVVVQPFAGIAEAKAAAKALADAAPECDKEDAARIAFRMGLGNLAPGQVESVKDILCGKAVRLAVTTFNAELKRGRAARPVVSAAKGEAPPWCPADLMFHEGAFWTWRLVETQTGKNQVPDKFVCGAFDPIARVTDADGTLRGLRIGCGGCEVTIPIEDLHAAKEQLAVTLHGKHGLECGTTRQAHDALAELMRHALRHDGLGTMIEVTRPGWHCDGAVYVCANGRVIGTVPGGATMRLADGSGYKDRAPGGVGAADAESAVYEKVWQHGPALWRFGDLIGLAAPCLDVVGCRSGGFSLDGSSRHGKTTTQHVQVGRAGSPDESEGRGGLIPFNPSPEAVEIPLRNATCNPFAMDELQNVRDPRDLQRFIFVMAGGSGKVRMKRSADAVRDTFTWRVLSTISTERTIADVLRTAGKAMVGGLVARYPSLSVTGLCDHTPANGTLAEEIKQTLFANHGHTLAAFVDRALIGIDLAQAVREWRELQAQLVGQDGHLKAPAEFFALAWWAGRQAARVGLTGGLTDESVAAVVQAAWANFAGRDEGEALAPGVVEIAALREYVATHLDRTIVRTDAPGWDGTYQDRAGYYDANHYYLLASKLDDMSGGTGNRRAVVAGLKAARVMILPKNSSSGDLTFTSIPGREGKVRHYRLDRAAVDALPEEDGTYDGAGDPWRGAAHDMNAPAG